MPAFDSVKAKGLFETLLVSESLDPAAKSAKRAKPRRWEPAFFSFTLDSDANLETKPSMQKYQDIIKASNEAIAAVNTSIRSKWPEASP